MPSIFIARKKRGGWKGIVELNERWERNELRGKLEGEDFEKKKKINFNCRRFYCEHSEILSATKRLSIIMQILYEIVVFLEYFYFEFFYIIVSKFFYVHISM